jgi:hypothetical protein
MKYTYAQRQKIIQTARETLARLRMAEAIDGMQEEQNEARRAFAKERQRQNDPTGNVSFAKRSNRAGLIYKVKTNARIFR